MDYVQIQNEGYFKIADSDALRPFFMSIVSDSNHWMFISSNGGLSAGRKNAQYSLFPYYTDDKITESNEVTGSKTILRVKKDGNPQVWEPFSDRNRDRYQITRNLYKNIHGNKILFEERNEDLGLTFRYHWNSSNEYGFVRKSCLINHETSPVEVAVLDGIQNIVPHGVGSDTQNRSSNLVDAYKRSELEPKSGLGIYALSAIIVDKAEPSEALKANVVWSLGLPEASHLLSSLQLDRFRIDGSLDPETDIKGEKGAYFLYDTITLPANREKEWVIVANVNQNHSAIVALCNELANPTALRIKLADDIALGTKRLIELNAASDAMQCTADDLKDARHFSNTLFNIMRGGIFDDNYRIERTDFSKYLAKANKNVYKAHRERIEGLAEIVSLQEIKAMVEGTSDADFERLCLEYLPLKFSRRHGDPSRPWNIFSINTHSEVDGSKILDYEGNWRDIFQNWEALAYAYPEFIDAMILKFFNASTFDGYNPYRVTKDGFDWEIIEPDDPWSYIGYWGDHQIIYSLKFLEFIQAHYPERLEAYFEKDIFVYANVPYKIKGYADLLANPKDTIEFDLELDEAIREERGVIGADAALIKNRDGELHHVNFIEKMLASVLSKLSNFIPEGGIWMNTQRPEWNDANNALVGNGVSMVTLYYLRRYLKFFDTLFEGAETRKFPISKELLDCFHGIFSTFQSSEALLKGSFDDHQRRTVLDGLGEAGDRFRTSVYNNAFSGKKQQLSSATLKEFFGLALGYMEHAIEANLRSDKLYHAYNLMSVEANGGVSIAYLSEMLEGQVAVLSSGYLNGRQAVDVLDGLKASSLFREDQYSYILYPNKELPKFLDKNTIPSESARSSTLLSKLVQEGYRQIIEEDANGTYHFNGNFKNANDVEEALDALELVVNADAKKEVLDIFENVFDHKSFTGRSGTFFGYEGLGSIYWHMVSKLLLAVKECCLSAIAHGENEEIVGRLIAHFYEINAGIGVHKAPSLYGAFPTDPYSHTPFGKGAQQPGMTGQVKEDILSRFGELGVGVDHGQISFDPRLLRATEFVGEPKPFRYVDVTGAHKEMILEPGTLGFTYCQVPVIYGKADTQKIEIVHKDASRTLIEGKTLNKTISQHLFERNGEIVQVNVSVKNSLT
ncbi:hypothetical protein ABV409_12405 [Flagellimonas sp. DF-77]|uniref:hypothetical protein n=1 Tax=Flagellimonas algarum TaxID=3230298 RepID=UPI00339B379A